MKRVNCPRNCQPRNFETLAVSEFCISVLNRRDNKVNFTSTNTLSFQLKSQLNTFSRKTKSSIQAWPVDVITSSLELFFLVIFLKWFELYHRAVENQTGCSHYHHLPEPSVFVTGKWSTQANIRAYLLVTGRLEFDLRQHCLAQLLAGRPCPTVRSDTYLFHLTTSQ